CVRLPCSSIFFFSDDTATPNIYTLSLHDALPISSCQCFAYPDRTVDAWTFFIAGQQESDCESRVWIPREELFTRDHHRCDRSFRSEEHTSELQSRFDLVCRLLLEKKNEIHKQ